MMFTGREPVEAYNRDRLLHLHHWSFGGKLFLALEVSADLP